MLHVEHIRREYCLHQLDESSCDPNPLVMCQRWLQEAIAAQVPEPTAMNLATVDEQGQPNARVVLLKSLTEQGFVFFSHYQSRKGAELTHAPRAALTFFWPELERQIRIQGQVDRISAACSDEYFQSRPWRSQLSACVSKQSSPIVSVKELRDKIEDLAQLYPKQQIPRPQHWGGYLLTPHTIEFWQGRENRLHDRVQYRLGDAQSWRKYRLAP